MAELRLQLGFSHGRFCKFRHVALDVFDIVKLKVMDDAYRALEKFKDSANGALAQTQAEEYENQIPGILALHDDALGVGHQRHEKGLL